MLGLLINKPVVLPIIWSKCIQSFLPVCHLVHGSEYPMFVFSVKWWSKDQCDRQFLRGRWVIDVILNSSPSYLIKQNRSYVIHVHVYRSKTINLWSFMEHFVFVTPVRLSSSFNWRMYYVTAIGDRLSFEFNSYSFWWIFCSICPFRVMFPYKYTLEPILLGADSGWYCCPMTCWCTSCYTKDVLCICL